MTRSQLIWIYTVCKDRAYPGSTGPGLNDSCQKKYLSRCCQIPRDFLQDPVMNESPKVCMPTFEFHSLKYRIYLSIQTDRSEQCKPRRESTTHPALFRHNRYLIVQIQILECVCLFVLRFYCPVNPMGSCRARSIYLTTLLLGRLRPLSGLPVLCTFFRQKLTTALLESAEGRE